MLRHNFSNDNIRTDHLKCDKCRSRNVLKSIEQFEGIETRSFECANCGAVKSIRMSPPSPLLAGNLL